MKKDLFSYEFGMLVGLVLMVLAALVFAQEHNPIVDARAGWSPPTYGTPVVHYVLQHSVNDGAWTTVGTTQDTIMGVNISFYDRHRVRVAGVDAQARQGPFSLPSDYYRPADVYAWPPDKPIRIDF